MSEFSVEEIKKSTVIFQNIISYLETNKFKISKERKIEIFQIWFYYLAGCDYHIWNHFKKTWRVQSISINIDMVSIRNLYSHATSILYELNDLSCCFLYKLKVQSGLNKSSIYDEMVYQTDIINRAICSQHVDNLRFLIESGLKFNQLEFNNENKSKSLLHLAFYCDNVNMFLYLLKLGCKVDLNDEIFYNK